MQDINPRADLVSSCSGFVSVWTLGDGFVRTFHLPGLFVRHWLGESASYRPSQGAAGFLLASAEPPGLCLHPDGAFAPRGLPDVHPGTMSGMCVCWAGPAGWGIATERKGKAASFFFLLQTLSHFNRWERQGLTQLKVMSFCCLALGQ